MQRASVFGQLTRHQLASERTGRGSRGRIFEDPKTYIYFETNTLGQNLVSRGTVQGDTWTWNNESKMKGKSVLARFTLRLISPDSATYKFEMGAVDEPMRLMMDGKQTRVK